jgi:ribosome biogenesis GTPase / thiamine phosphate phosphatase
VLDTSFESLIPYGWNDRVLALYNSSAGSGEEPARVLRVERTRSTVIGLDGRDHSLTVAAPPAVGDWVSVTATAICQVLERWSVLARAAPHGGDVQILAANIDLVLITVPADRIHSARVERELALAWDSGARPLVVLTKADLSPPGAFDELAERLLGVDVVAASVLSGDGLAELAAALRPDRTAVLIGPSGAGKSTLANALVGTNLLATGEVRAQDQRGRHTTTSRQLMAVPGGGVLIDTPGLRSLGLAISDGAIEAVFPEIEELAQLCRFSDCRHQVEPGCAVTGAVEEGQLEPERLASFHKLDRELQAFQRRSDPLARRAEVSLWKARAKSARIHDKRKPRPTG